MSIRKFVFCFYKKNISIHQNVLERTYFKLKLVANILTK